MPSSKRILVAEDRLASDPVQRHSDLRDYFCDKDASATRTRAGWELTLGWPSGRERHVDPKLEQVLADWGIDDLSQMALARRREGRVLSCLYDSWTLLSWSEWFEKSGRPLDQSITILHVDDHRDLGTPRLALGNDSAIDLITGEPFDLESPPSVQAAIESGAVGMGSFLTPFLLRLPHADVRHLVQAPKHCGTKDFTWRATQERDDLLRPGASRPGLTLHASESGTGPGRYRATDELSDWLMDLDDAPVLLHIDMDFFNNRYDGDGSWMDRRDRLDPPLERLLARVDEVADGLRGSGALARIEDAVIAFSPGFFPAEFWSAAQGRLRERLPELYG